MSLEMIRFDQKKKLTFFLVEYIVNQQVLVGSVQNVLNGESKVGQSHVLEMCIHDGRIDNHVGLVQVLVQFSPHVDLLLAGIFGIREIHANIQIVELAQANEALGVKGYKGVGGDLHRDVQFVEQHGQYDSFLTRSQYLVPPFHLLHAILDYGRSPGQLLKLLALANFTIHIDPLAVAAVLPVTDIHVEIYLRLLVHLLVVGQKSFRRDHGLRANANLVIHVVPRHFDAPETEQSPLSLHVAVRPGEGENCLAFRLARNVHTDVHHVRFR